MYQAAFLTKTAAIGADAANAHNVPQLSSCCAMQRTALALEPAVHGSCGEGVRRAHPVNSAFSLHALAARKMRHERQIRCRRAAEETTIHADRSMDQASKLQIAGLSRHWPLGILLTQHPFASAVRSLSQRKSPKQPLGSGLLANRWRLRRERWLRERPGGTGRIVLQHAANP